VGVYASRPLSPATWPDFERLFTGGAGWDFCGCMVWHRGSHLSRVDYPTRREAGTRNRADHRALVAAGQARGILVYDGDEPVGWCQFGPADSHWRPFASETDTNQRQSAVDWRITCFVVARSHRRRGVARTALRAALDAIAAAGGGVVGAYALADGRPSAAYGGWVAQFAAAGFTAAGPCDRTRVRMRRTV
jgi:GNAT superfamily N-acetyltransferase